MHTTGTRPLTADDVVEEAVRIVDAHGADALTMRRLADELGVAVTSIYWHVGNREELLDAVIDHLIEEMGTVRARGRGSHERIATLAHGLRRTLLARPQLIALAHERAQTTRMFQPVQAAIARELDVLGLTGADAERTLRALQVHVVSSVLLERTVDRLGTEDPVDALDLFGFTLDAILATLPPHATDRS
ncbi:MAG: TetR/AcrR family transcriptional regulator [Actinomycetota bacterium]